MGRLLLTPRLPAVKIPAFQQIPENLNVRFCAVLLAAMALAACGETKSQDYYMSHPSELAADLEECKKTGMKTYNCNEADKAAVILQKKGGDAGK